MNRLIWAPALCLALAATSAARAATPVDADPNRDYPVTPEAGPWMICAAHFTGPSAPDLARQTVLQIRSRYNLPAYVFNYADEERKKQKALLDRQAPPVVAPEPGSETVVPVPRHHATVRVEEQCAVMIGGYPDENAAHVALLAVKKLPPPELKVPDGVLPFSQIIDHGHERVLNPFATQSMVVRNPAIPRETRSTAIKDDPFLKTLNADEEYSMLRCPGTWTLAVKEYLGASLVQNGTAESSGFLNMLGMGRSSAGESLNVAANNAHELAKSLRRVGCEAYVLHTRTSSVVSIGAFSGPDDPTMNAVRERYARWQKQVAAVQPDPSKKDPLGLFPYPVPVEVPHPQ